MLHPATLLRSGAAVFVVLGIAITTWLVDKAIRYPGVRASQFGYSAPLWIPASIFVVLCTVAGSYVLLRAARRVDEGDDLFAERHRRRPGASCEGKQDA